VAQRSASFIFGPGGGRSWSAHFEFTRINIEPIILCKKIEDVREARDIAKRCAVSEDWLTGKAINLEVLDSSRLKAVEAMSVARKPATDHCCRGC
jgi:hypothetical protein